MRVLLSRWRLLSIIGVALVVLIIGVFGFLQLIKQSATPSPMPLLSSATLLPSSVIILPSPVPEASITPMATPSNLALTITYTRGPKFTLAIAAMKPTTSQPTFKAYEPATGAPYALIQFLNPSGQMVSEFKFSAKTEVHLEGENLPPIYALPQSTAHVVIPGSALGQAVKVQIITSQGNILAERDLPKNPPLSWFKQLQKTVWGDWRLSNVQAQTADTFNIIIINEKGAEYNLGLAVANTESMVASLSPWATYGQRIVVTALTNTTTDLGCSTVDFGDNVLPICADDERVITTVESLLAPLNIPRWNVVIVVNLVDCACGSVANGTSPVIAVGSRPTLNLIAHEMGHAVGHMIDEYLYQPQFASLPPQPLGPNCFASQVSCQEATTAVSSEDECALGCSSTTSWRPSTRIMHNTYDVLAYGPWEECLMHKAIAEAMGEQFSCTPAPSPTPEPSQKPEPQGPFYWGWRR